MSFQLTLFASQEQGSDATQAAAAAVTAVSATAARLQTLSESVQALTATVEVDTHVESLEKLLVRRADPIISERGYAYNNEQPYTNAASGLSGYRADIVGLDTAGSITVVGEDGGAAAILILIAPGDDPGSATVDPGPFIDAFRLEGE